MKPLWIKICGMTAPEAVSAAVAQGVDAIGFVFSESVRRVAPRYAAELASAARGRVRCVAVTRHPTQDEVDEIFEVFKPDALQTDLVDLARLSIPRLLEILPVARAGNPLPEPLPARMLFEGQSSGTGIPCDWNLARDIAGRTQLVLAGGLNPQNVGEAIASVRPFGVDVSSGVERQPGVKSADSIALFVAAARAMTGHSQ